VLVALATLSSPLRAWAEEEMLLGRTSAGGLKVRVEFNVLGLPVSPFPNVSGYATGEVGFHSTILDDPADDFYQPSPAPDFRFILLQKDAGVEVWNDHGSAFMTNGESFYIGSPPFDTHPVWNIVSGTAGNTYSVILFVRDVNGIYSDSAPFTVSFTPVAPAVLSIQSNSNATVTVSFTGTPGLDYVVQVASALGPNTQWTSISTNNAGDTGVWTLTEFTAGHTARFYRAITP
jgi:hypothetical protein